MVETQALRVSGRSSHGVDERLEMRGLQLPGVERRHAPVLTVRKEVVRRRSDAHARSEHVLPAPCVKAVGGEADGHVGDERYLARGMRELLVHVELRPLMKSHAFCELGAGLLDAPGARRLQG